jgi:hypothetical protein
MAHLLPAELPFGSFPAHVEGYGASMRDGKRAELGQRNAGR